MIYDDPITQLKPEGVADIVRLLDTEDYYEVRFVADPNTTHPRFIY